MPYLKRMMGLYQGYSFRIKLMLALLVISSFMSILLGVLSYTVSAGMIHTMGKRLSEHNISVIQKSLNSYFQSVEDQLTQVIRLPIVRNALEREQVNANDQDILQIQVSNAIMRTLYSGSANEQMKPIRINFYFKNGYTHDSMSNNVFPYSDYESAFKYYIEDDCIIDQNYISANWCESRTLKDSLGREHNYIIGVRMLYDSSTLNKLGIMIFAVDEADVYQQYSSFSSIAFIMHSNGKLLSGADKSLLGNDVQDQSLKNKILQSTKRLGSFSEKSGKEQSLVSFQRLGGNSTYFVVPFNYYKGLLIDVLNKFTTYFILITMGGMAMATLVALFLSRGVASSLLKLTKVVQEVYEGDLNVRFIINSSDEIAYLGGKFNAALDQINHLFEIQKEDSRIKHHLKLRLLQSQINPHLLYNTLDSVLWALKNENTSIARELIQSLSNYFKITLSGGSVLISLSSELAMISYYLAIQEISRGKNYSLIVQMPDEIKMHRIIKLTIQPLIENSVIHGFPGYREDDGILTIEVKVEGDLLIIWVQDNGIGMLPEELHRINEIIQTYPPMDGQKQFALYNVNWRIKNMFGAPYGIYLESEVGEYTRTVITMPYKHEDGGDYIVQHDDY